MSVAWRLRTSNEIGYFATLENVFSKDEIEKIKTQALKFELEEARVFNKVQTEKPRISKIRWFQPDDETNWVYKKMVDLIHLVNNQVFNMNLYGMEPLQYTTYNHEELGFYGPHIDTAHILEGNLARKLSFSVQLSDVGDYEGGELVVGVDHKPKTMDKNIGSVHFFLSDIVHEVKPVTKGERHSLVGWIVGPPKV
jgi:PKHD-type hydroxylase